jgi:putative addiction module antidote
MGSTVRKIGNSDGIIIPKDVLDIVGLRTGDAVDFLPSKGELRIRVVDNAADFESRMQVARERMKKYEVALRELAK